MGAGGRHQSPNGGFHRRRRRWRRARREGPTDGHRLQAGPEAQLAQRARRRLLGFKERFGCSASHLAHVSRCVRAGRYCIVLGGGIEWIRAEKGSNKAYNKRCRAMQCCVATRHQIPALPVSPHFEGVGNSPIRAFRSDRQQAPSGAS
jgi:hypothetical protein